MRPESCRFLLAQPSSHYVPPERAAGPRQRTERGRAAGPVSAGAPRGPPRASAQLFRARELCPRPVPAPAASRLSILVRVTGRLKIPSSLPQACRPLTPCLESMHFATDRRGRGTEEPRAHGGFALVVGVVGREEPSPRGPGSTFQHVPALSLSTFLLGEPGTSRTSDPQCPQFRVS